MFSVHDSFWWGVGDLTTQSNSALTTQQTLVWHSCTTLIANSQLISCIHKEPQTILDYLNIKAVKTTFVDSTRDSLGERNLVQMNIDSSLIPK